MDRTQCRALGEATSSSGLLQAHDDDTLNYHYLPINWLIYICPALVFVEC
jgi:hypothetical protein